MGREVEQICSCIPDLLAPFIEMLAFTPEADQVLEYTKDATQLDR
jgi:hypothetical protein